MALEIDRLDDHEQFPAGTLMVSPAAAVCTAALTSLYEQEFGVSVAAAAGTAAQKIRAMTQVPTILLMVI
jgi:hypothetical protein